ncbi:MAG TPA: HD domain-containing phosphohydrolase [Pyrinomonadaceae bacterium]|nr:HD domain-containing phosphohydrolase [Pyrinomonadaceae bacterium]
MSDRMRKVLHAFAALADLGEEIAETSDFEEMVRSALHVVQGALGIHRGAVAEYRRETSTLSFVAVRGMGEEFPREMSFAPEGDGGAGDEVSWLDAKLSPRFETWQVEMVSPLLVRGELVGVILLGGKASGEPFFAEDNELVRALGRHIGVGLHNHRLLREVEIRANENLRLYDELRAIYKDTVRAFAAAIDCKDKYTQGHSERVGKYSEIIAREMGWSPEEVEGISVAGYLHDIGKLVVDRNIINSPHRIDAKQSSELNKHPAAGYEILSPINHPYADIPLMARYHHERLDGRGYPCGLKGDEIPIGAKIVSLADSFDAMTTDRPYRRRRNFDEVLEDFRRNTGKQFAPEVVAAFCRALLKEVKGETRPRSILRLLGKGYADGEDTPAQLEALIAELESDAYLTAAQA